MAPPAPPRDHTGAAAAAGVIPPRSEAEEEAEAVDETEREPVRREWDRELAVPLDWQQEGSEDEDDEEVDDEEEDDDEVDDEVDDDEEDVPGDVMEMETDTRELFAESFDFSKYFNKGKGKKDEVIESMANAQSLFCRRWSFPDGLEVIVRRIDCLRMAEDILDLMLKLEVEGGNWTITNIDRLKQATRLDGRLRQLEGGLRRLWASLKKQQPFEDANALRDLATEIDGLCTLQPASTNAAVMLITTSVSSLLVGSATASPPYEELMVACENLWGSVSVAREEEIVYPCP